MVTPLGPWKKVREGLDHRHEEKASTFGRFQILRNAHIGCSVACDAAAMAMQSPSIHADSTSLKPSELAFGTHEKKSSIGALEWVRVSASAHILRPKSATAPHVQCKGEGRSANQSSGVMDCYVTVQESGKRLTEYVAELPLIVQVMRLTTVLPSQTDRYPHPARGGPFQLGSQSLQRGDGLLRNGSGIWKAAHR
jgi:hypothetical protein